MNVSTRVCAMHLHELHSFVCFRFFVVFPPALSFALCSSIFVCLMRLFSPFKCLWQAFLLVFRAHIWLCLATEANTCHRIGLLAVVV